MAHFFDATTTAPLVDCPLQVGQKKTVGLFGGDFFGNDLGVIIDQSLVKMQEKKPGKNFRYFELTGLKPGDAILHAYAGLFDYAIPIGVKVTKKMFTPQGKLVQRQAIVNEARSHAGKAHYLWGAAGNSPGMSDGAKYRPSIVKMQVDSFDTKKPSVQTAFTDIGGRNTCAGSSNTVIQLTTQATNDYLALRKQVGDMPLPLINVTPRLYKFNGEVKPIGVSHNGIVWGGGCENVKHFDCIGFVNYCYSLFVAQSKYPFGTSIVEFMTRPANYGFVVVADSTDVLDADIIAQYSEKGGWHHIGMVYMEGKTAKIVQAADSPIGVTDTAIYHAAQPGAWTKRIRIMDNML
ncbi:hypothetical protein [Spirosoma endbachense]|uniref:Uncharacterized protein n=1 Tax=Spirosoma endbachense TaxID=2666025 RepID=A0A6P1VW63_9BACT|nr:hypothetical protein [Spirosoma endbachense]QHV96080.1 hypothetical protein GJR95_14160 [Spirosoma endbachense]